MSLDISEERRGFILKKLNLKNTSEQSKNKDTTESKIPYSDKTKRWQVMPTAPILVTIETV